MYFHWDSFLFQEDTMKAVVVKEIGSFRYCDVNVPAPAQGEVLVKVDVTGLCRTDLKIIKTGHRDLILPRIPGEEVVGTVIQLGPGSNGVVPGQRVYIYPGTSCGSCRQCLNGAENLCKEMRIMGFHRHGGFAEYVAAPVQSLIPIPDEIPDEEAIFTEPLSCCLNALELAGLRDGESICIWGGGPAGTLLKRASEAMGGHALIIDPDTGRMKLAQGEAVPPDKEFDIAIVAVGARGAYKEAMERLAPRGRLAVFSGLQMDGSNLDVDLNRLHYLEQTFVGAYGCSFRHGEEALAMIRSGEVKVRDMISHRMRLGELDAALGIVERKEGMKVLLYP